MDKKKYRVIIALMFAAYVALIITAFIHLEKYAAVNTAQVRDVTVVIDPGHGGEDGGAVANNIIEKDINLSVAKKVFELFELSGFKAILTRSKDTMINLDGTSLRERKVSDMKNRLNVFNSDESNVVLSIHQNKFTDSKYSGAQVFYSQNSQESQRLAQNLRESIITMLQPENTREIKPADKNIYLLYNAKVPSVIVECGFLSNAEEAAKLSDEEYQKQIAFAIYTGFLTYYYS